MKKLVDHRQIKYLDLTMHEQDIFVRKKAALSELFSGEKCAIVAPTDAGFGLARIHDALIGGSEIDTAVFRDINEALVWLDIDLDNEELVRG